MAFPTTGLLDALTGTNGDDLNVYSASWTSPPTGANSLEIQGNAATATVDLAYAANMWATTYGPDVEIYVPIDTLPATGVPIMLLARCQQETSMATVDGYALYYQPGSLRISRVDNGALTDLATAAITLAAGDLIGLEIIGSTLKAYRFTSSWAEVLSATDTTYSAAGKIGLYSYGNTVRIGALYGGTVVATPTFSVQPQSQSAASGGTVTFNCTVADATSLQWETAPITSLYSDVPGTWSNASGTSTVEDYTTGTLSSSDNGKWYRLKASNASGDTYSEPVRVWITGLGISGRGLAGGRFVRRPWLKRGRAGSASPLIKAVFPGDKDTTETTVFTDFAFGTPGSGGINGTSSTTQGSNTVSATGQLALSGSASITQAGNTVAATGQLAIQGSSSTTQGDTTVSAAGGGASPISGAASITQGDNTCSAAGALSIQGSGSTAQAGNTVSAAGALSIQGSTSISQAGSTVSAAGQLAMSGSASTPQAGNTVSGTAQLAIAGTSSATQGDTTLAATGAGTAGNTGSADLTQAGHTVSASAVLAIQGSAAFGQAGNSLSATGAVAIIGTLAAQLDDTTVSASGQIYLAGTASLAQAPNTLSAAGSGASGVYPDPTDVAAGVQYGPTGVEYTGTKSGGGAYLRRR